MFEGLLPSSLPAMVADCHGRAVTAGWYTDLNTGGPLNRSLAEMMALEHSELSERLEAVRKNLQSDHIPGFSGEEEETADSLIRLFDYCGYRKLRTEEAYLRKKYVFSSSYEVEQAVNDPAELIAWEHAKISNRLLAVRGHVGPIFIAEENAVIEQLMLVVHYCKLRGLRIGDAYLAKLEYNRNRADHTLEARKAAGGKKF